MPRFLGHTAFSGLLYQSESLEKQANRSGRERESEGERLIYFKELGPFVTIVGLVSSEA